MSFVIFVPEPQLKAFKKEFSGKPTRKANKLKQPIARTVVAVHTAQRRILPKLTRKANKLKQKLPISHTLVAVHTAMSGKELEEVTA